MFVEMTCQCMATFQVEADDNETMVIGWAQQFVEAHKPCGYMSGLNTMDKQEQTKRYTINNKQKEE